MGVSLRPTGAAEGRGSEGTPPEGSIGVPMGVREPQGRAVITELSGESSAFRQGSKWRLGVHPLPPPRHLIKANPSLPGRRGCGPGSGLPGRSGGVPPAEGTPGALLREGERAPAPAAAAAPCELQIGGSCVNSEGKGGADRCSASRIRLFGWKKPDGKLRPRYLFALAASRGREPPQKEGEPTALRDWGLGLFPWQNSAELQRPSFPFCFHLASNRRAKIF